MKKSSKQQAIHRSVTSGEHARREQPNDSAPAGGKDERVRGAQPTANARVQRVAFEDAVTEPSTATLAGRAAKVPRRAAKGDDDLMSQQQS